MNLIQGIWGNFLEEVAFELGFEGQIEFEGLKLGQWKERDGAEHSGPMISHDLSKKDELIFSNFSIEYILL